MLAAPASIEARVSVRRWALLSFAWFAFLRLIWHGDSIWPNSRDCRYYRHLSSEMKGGNSVRDYSAEDREQRERLERNSGGGQRANVVGMVNQLAKIHDKRALPGLSAYGVIRLLQSNGGAQAKAARRHNRAHDAFLERLHPGSELARAAAEPRQAPGSH